MNFFKRRVHVPYAKIRNANTLRNNTTRNDWPHWEGYREQIRQVLEQTLAQNPCGRGHLLLLGAGNGNDVPVSYLEGVFDRITIVDIDDKALDRFLAKAGQPGKFTKAVIDLTGIGKEIHSLSELRQQAASLQPEIDFSRLSPPFDMVINLCFSSQLISAFFYQEKDKPAISPEFSSQLDRLIERIHVHLFNGVYERLAGPGIVVHLTDVLVLQKLKETGSSSPAKVKAEELTRGLPGGISGNLGLIQAQLPDFARQGLCLPGAFVHLQEDILKRFRLLSEHALLWDFVDDRHEDRDYLVTAHVMGKK